MTWQLRIFHQEDNVGDSKKVAYCSAILQENQTMFTISSIDSLLTKLSLTSTNTSCCARRTLFGGGEPGKATSGYLNQNVRDNLVHKSCPLHHKEIVRRKFILSVLVSSGFIPISYAYAKTKTKNPYDERRLLEQNKRRQRENNVPEDFPNFVREGFEVKVITSDNYVKRDSGLIYKDYEVGKGDCPKAGQQVIFHYIGYNESGRRIDSTYLQGSPARIRMGTNALVPGFEQGIQDMRPGGKRRIIIPPELGPPVGPSTFFSAKQFEVFDVELLSIQNCQRRTIGFYSDIICDS